MAMARRSLDPTRFDASQYGRGQYLCSRSRHGPNHSLDGNRRGGICVGPIGNFGRPETNEESHLLDLRLAET